MKVYLYGYILTLTCVWATQNTKVSITTKSSSTTSWDSTVLDVTTVSNSNSNLATDSTQTTNNSTDSTQTTNNSTDSITSINYVTTTREVSGSVYTDTTFSGSTVPITNDTRPTTQVTPDNATAATESNPTDRITNALNNTTGITSAENGTSLGNHTTQLEADEPFSSKYIIVGAVLGGCVVVLVLILVVCHLKKRSTSSKGKRYHVDSEAFRLSQYDENVQIIDQESQRKSDGSPNYHMIDEEIFIKNRTQKQKSHKNNASKSEDKTKQSNEITNESTSGQTEPDMKRNDSKLSNKSQNSSQSIKNSSHTDNTCNGNVDHVYTKPAKRGHTIQILDSASRNSDKSSQMIRKSNTVKQRVEDSSNKMNNNLKNDTTQDIIAGEVDDIDDDDEVYLNASSGPVSKMLDSNVKQRVEDNSNKMNNDLKNDRIQDIIAGEVDDIDDDDEVYLNASSGPVSKMLDSNVRQRVEDSSNKMNNDLNNDISKDLTAWELDNIDDDDEVYLNASSGPVPKTVDNDCKADTTQTAVEDIYDIASPIDDDDVQVDEKEKSKEPKKDRRYDDIEEGHYDVTEPENCQNPVRKQSIQRKDQKIDSDSEDDIYENHEDDDNGKHINDETKEEYNNDNSNDDTYDCAVSKNDEDANDDTYYDCAINKTLQIGASDNIYDSTLESNYDMTQHESNKRRFIVVSTDDNYDHCELPSEREDYELVVLPEDEA